MSDVAYETAVEPEAGETPGSGQCQVFTADDVPESCRWQDFVKRCPNRAEALIWYSCPNGHQYPEEVCSGHVDPPGDQWCGLCASEGLAVSVTIALIGWI